MILEQLDAESGDLQSNQSKNLTCKHSTTTILELASSQTIHGNRCLPDKMTKSERVISSMKSFRKIKEAAGVIS